MGKARAGRSGSGSNSKKSGDQLPPEVSAALDAQKKVDSADPDYKPNRRSKTSKSDKATARAPSAKPRQRTRDSSSTPRARKAPSVPSAPEDPSLPSAPEDPSLPSAPEDPSTPDVSNAPAHPGLDLANRLNATTENPGEPNSYQAVIADFMATRPDGAGTVCFFNASRVSLKFPD